MKNLIEQMVKSGGVIVNSSQLTRLEIAQAQACHRFYVDDNSLGYALMPNNYSVLREVANFFQDIDITLDFAISDKEKLSIIDRHLKDFAARYFKKPNSEQEDDKKISHKQ